MTQITNDASEYGEFGIIGNAITEVICRLPINDIMTVGLLNKTWHSLSICSDVWNPIVVTKLQSITELLTQQIEQIASLITKRFADPPIAQNAPQNVLQNAPHNANRIATKERLELLKNTLEYASAYTSEQLTKQTFRCYQSLPQFYAHLKSLYSIINEIRIVTQGIECSRYFVTRNFDIFDIMCRRKVIELMKIYPSDLPKGNTSYAPRYIDFLSDTASAFWNSNFSKSGETAFNVDFDKFVGLFLGQEGFDVHRGDPRFVGHLMYQINPIQYYDKIMTPWKLMCLVSNFGPLCADFATSFSRIMLSNGFTGFVTLRGAEDMIFEDVRKHAKKENIVMIRNSRRYPYLLAITILDPKTARVEHTNNLSKTGRIIPIAKYIHEKCGDDVTYYSRGVSDVVFTHKILMEYACHDKPFINL